MLLIHRIVLVGFLCKQITSSGAEPCVAESAVMGSFFTETCVTETAVHGSFFAESCVTESAVTGSFFGKSCVRNDWYWIPAIVHVVGDGRFVAAVVHDRLILKSCRLV